MSSCCRGVQQCIKEIAPHAVYVHCYAHCLNVVLVDCTKSVSDASDFFFTHGNSVHIHVSKQSTYTISSETD